MDPVAIREGPSVPQGRLGLSSTGETTLLLGEGTAPAPDDTFLEEAVGRLMNGGTARLDAIKQVARKRGTSKREVYGQLLREK